MASVIRNQVIAGQTVGAGVVFGFVLIIIMAALVGMNSYHMGNFLDAKLNHSESFAWEVVLYIVGAGIAALEIPLGKSLVTTYRLHGLNLSVVFQGLLACIIAGMAVFAGVNSQLADADRRDTATSAHTVKSTTFESMRRSAKLTLDAALIRANRINNEESKKISKLDAKAAYQNELTRITTMQANHTAGKPVKMFHSDSDEQRVTIMLFSIVCSFGALFASMFHAVFINPLVALPAFSLKAKANHDWDSDGSDFKSAKHELSPLANQFNGFLDREKVPSKVLHPTSETGKPNTSGSGDDKNRPQQADTRAGAVLNNSEPSGVRTQDTQTKKGATVEYETAHYHIIKSRIAREVIKPTVRAVKGELLKFRVRFVDDAARQTKANEILEEMKRDHVLIDNPDYQKTGRVVSKYILNPDYSEEELHPDEEVRTECPACTRVSVVSKKEISAWGGRVGCPNCTTDYSAAEHTV